MNEMPNLTGVSARPRFISRRFLALQSCDRRAAGPVVGEALQLGDQLAARHCPRPSGRRASGRARRAVEVAAAHLQRIAARAPGRRASITRSIAIMPCGPPKPRNAVLETVWVRKRCETISPRGRK